MPIPSDILSIIYSFLNTHEISCIENVPCKVCVNFVYFKSLDQDIDNSLIKNYCKSDKELVKKIPIKKLTSKTQRIHVIGNHWPLINSLKHRKFSFFCNAGGTLKLNKRSINRADSICITDMNGKMTIDNIKGKMIITQGYQSELNFESIDFLLIEKKYLPYMQTTPWVPFELLPFEIPKNGFLVINIKNNKKFYTEE